MKKHALLAAFFVLTLFSCSVESDDEPTFYLEVMPIESVNVPEEFVHGQTYEISVTYTRPNSCYEFNDFIYEISGHERTVAVVNTVYSDSGSDCTQNPVLTTVSFDFMVSGTDTYVFKFYQGEDSEGSDQYYLVEVPVSDGRHYQDNSSNKD